MGFTINRVSLFALIFSIGILVDDAIVVVENIHRHMRLGGKTLLEAIPPAVDEVGGSPTILATFTVIAAPAAHGLRVGPDGPVHAPDPDQRLGGHAAVAGGGADRHALAVAQAAGASTCRRRATMGTARQRAVVRTSAPRLRARAAALPGRTTTAARAVGAGCSLASAWHWCAARRYCLAVVQLVVLKMLPFDNKSEFQVVVDLPEGTPLERTNALLLELAADSVAWQPEVLDVQGYAGTVGPGQLQWPGAPVLPAQRRQRRRPAGEPGGQARPRPQEPRHRPRGALLPWRRSASATARR